MPDFLAQYSAQILHLAGMHLLLVLTSGIIAAVLALVLAIAVTRPRRQWLQAPLLDTANALQTIPTLSVIGIASALFSAIGQGVGWLPALTALVAYSILPVLGNAITGLQNVNADVLRAARGMGMDGGALLRQVELPLAAPLILTGLRTALVINVGTAALAAAIGVDCLGTLIFQGISTGNVGLILAGAIPTTVLAVMLDSAIALLGRIYVPEMVI